MSEERRPFVRWEISLGNIAVLVTLVLTILQGGQLLGQMRAEVAQQAQTIEQMRVASVSREQRLMAVERVASQAADAAAQDARRLVEIETRLRSAETAGARADERMANILTYLARIDARLERIERNGGYEQP